LSHDDLWSLIEFEHRFHQWVFADNPPRAWYGPVLRWMLTLRGDPLANARYDSKLGFPWLFAVIPNAGDEVCNTVCSYTIRYADRSLTCSVITTLRLPLL